MKDVDMTVWHTARTTRWTGKAAIVAGLLAVLLVATVPAALLAGVIMMLLGHVVAGLALFGAWILAAGAAAAIAGLSGVRYVRELVSPRGFRVVQLGRGEYDYN
jgi:uncharacterized membrane protein